jgi:hypothetical protein
LCKEPNLTSSIIVACLNYGNNVTMEGHNQNCATNTMGKKK